MFYILLCTGRFSSRYWGRQWKSTHKGMSLYKRKGIGNYSNLNCLHDFQLYEPWFNEIASRVIIWNLLIKFMLFFLTILLNTFCRVEIGWYSRYRVIRWTVFVWKWNLRTKFCHFPLCWRTRRNTRLIHHERYYSQYMPYINLICETLKMFGSRTVIPSSTSYSSLI